MNPINRLPIVLFLAFAALTGLGAQTVVDQLYGLRNYELADAYWAAGQKFIDLGQPDRGAEFQTRAKQIFKGFVPGQVPKAAATQVLPVLSPRPAPVVPAADTVKESNLQGQKIARLQFQKLLRGYLTGDPATIASVLGTSVKLQGSAFDPAVLGGFLKDHPAEAGAPDDLYQTASLKMTDGPGQSVSVTIQANPGAPGSLDTLVPFWKGTQIFTFDRVGDTWKLVDAEGN